MSPHATNPLGVLATYSELVLVASLAGGWLTLVVRLTHTRLQVAISFVAGLMLGIALLHFLPDAAEHLDSLDRTVKWMLGGFLAVFFLQRFFHFHHHDSSDGDPEQCRPSRPGHAREHGTSTRHSDKPSHHACSLAEKSALQLSWVGTALGLTLHSLMDGLALTLRSRGVRTLI